MQVIPQFTPAGSKYNQGVLPSDYFLTLAAEADAASTRATLGLGTAAVKNTGTSGNVVPLLDGVNTWANTQTFQAPVNLKEYTIATLPSASPAEKMATVSDGTAGRHVVVSDGTIWRYVDGTPVTTTAYTAYTPVLSVSSGSGFTYTPFGEYTRIGDTIFVTISCTVTSIGTGTGIWFLTLPVVPASAFGQCIFGRETAVTGNVVMGTTVGGGSNKIVLTNNSNATPVVSGAALVYSGSYVVDH